MGSIARFALKDSVRDANSLVTGLRQLTSASGLSRFLECVLSLTNFELVAKPACIVCVDGIPLIRIGILPVSRMGGCGDFSSSIGIGTVIYRDVT